MTILKNKHGVTFDTEVILNDPSSHFAHRVLAIELLKQRNEMYALLDGILPVINGLDEEALGYVVDTPDRQGWFIRDEVSHGIGNLLAKARGEL